MNTKICTLIEQSKKLIELGIDVNTADMWYLPIEINEEKGYELVLSPSLTRGIIPAWSLSALLQLLPNDDNRSPVLCRNMRFNKWWVVYHSTAIDKAIQTETYDEPIDAAFEMVCWLLENKKL